jgi:Bacterial Ig domain
MRAGRVSRGSIGPARPTGRFAALAVSAALLLLAAGPSSADAQDIVNTGNWLTSITTTGHDGNHPEGRHIRLSLLVEHPRGRKVTGLKIDQDWDASEESAGSGTITAGLDVEQPNVAGGFNYSRVNYDFLTAIDAIAPGVYFNSGTLHVRAVLDDGSVSAPASSALSFLTAVNIPDFDQTAIAYQWGAGFFGGTTPGGQVLFGVLGKDLDPRTCFISIPPTCMPEAFAGVEWRTRNQLTGATTAATRTCPGAFESHDDDGRGVNAQVTLPDRGTFAVEGQLLTADKPPPFSNDLFCLDAGGPWWPLGSIDVNSSSIPPPALGIGPRPVVGGDVTVLAQVPRDPDKADGGLVQYMEWDVDGNPSNGTNGFDRATLGPYDLGLGEGTIRSETIDTEGMTPGLKTVRVRVTDNGAMSGADDIRATSEVATAQYLVDSPPVIDPASVDAAVDESLSVPLSASDADGDSITWSVTDDPDHGTGSLTDASGTSNTYTFTPDPGFAGRDSVTFRVADGWGGTDTREVELRYRPDTTIDSASPEAFTQETDASFEFSSDATGVSFVCFLIRPQGPTLTQFCTSPVEYSSLPEGDYEFSVRAASGPVVDFTPAVHEWTIDTTAPETAISNKPGPRIMKSSRRAKVRFAFAAGEKASFECKLDQKSFAGCGSPVTYRVKPGRHTFSVQATDEAGNLGPAEQASFRFKRKR